MFIYDHSFANCEMVNYKLQKDLESRIGKFKGFVDLAIFLRKNVDGGIGYSTLAKRMGYTKGYGAYIQKVESKRVPASMKMMLSYLAYFDLQPNLFFQVISKGTPNHTILNSTLDQRLYSVLRRSRQGIKPKRSSR